MARKRTEAQTSLDLDKLKPQGAELPDVGALADQMKPFVTGAIETLGREAAAGNVIAAKTIIDFLAAAAREDKGSRGTDVLKQIAEIRRGAS